METKRTPGPWQIGSRYGNNRTEILSSTGDRAIATVWTHDRKRIDKQPRGDDDFEENPAYMANARLIAAAPELLELANTAAAMADDAANYMSDERILPCDESEAIAEGLATLAMRLRAAIAKATT